MSEVSHAPSTGIPPVKPGGKCGYQMQQIIETHLPHLSRPQLTGLVLWVCGAILAGSACQNAVASALSPWGAWNNFRQYLREWLYDGSDRARPCQTELDVSLCFAPLLRWVLAWWRSSRLALAVDPTLKGDQTTAIVISVVYRGCAIPVAWRILRANQRGAWMDPIVELLQALAPAVPREMTVVVLCDRGLASPKLWNQIRAQGWHPYMRYPKNVTFCAEGGRRLPARAFVPRPDTAWIGSGTAFGRATAKRRCTLLAVWYVEPEEPWILLTDLPLDEVGSEDAQCYIRGLWNTPVRLRPPLHSIQLIAIINGGRRQGILHTSAPVSRLIPHPAVCRGKAGGPSFRPRAKRTPRAGC